MNLSKKDKIISLTFIITILVLLYLPIFSMVIFSFNGIRSVTRLSGFSFQWYKEIFVDKAFFNAVISTFIIAITSTIFSVLIGTFGAIALTRVKPKTSKIFLFLNNVPMISPEIITAISLFVIFGVMYIPAGYLTIILAHITFSTPYVIVTIYPKLKMLDTNLSDAAADLGATPLQTIFKVILPQLRGAIISASMIAFAMSFDDFVISYFVAGDSGVQNISIYLYTLKRDVKPTINAFSTLVLMVVVGKILFDILTWKKKQEKARKRGQA